MTPEPGASAFEDLARALAEAVNRLGLHQRLIEKSVDEDRRQLRYREGEWAQLDELLALFTQLSDRLTLAAATSKWAKSPPPAHRPLAITPDPLRREVVRLKEEKGWGRRQIFAHLRAANPDLKPLLRRGGRLVEVPLTPYYVRRVLEEWAGEKSAKAGEKGSPREGSR